MSAAAWHARLRRLPWLLCAPMWVQVAMAAPATPGGADTPVSRTSRPASPVLAPFFPSQANAEPPQGCSTPAGGGLSAGRPRGPSGGDAAEAAAAARGAGQNPCQDPAPDDWLIVSAEAGVAPAAPWVFAGLPDQQLPATRFSVHGLPGQPVLRVQAQASYGNLVHRLAGAEAGALVWRWRVERALQGADLRTRQGDDVALKVCALFDLPPDALPFWERQLLRLAESRAGQRLPTATLCYVWDPAWPAESIVPNAYSGRVRYLTLGGAPQAWHSVSRDLAADFLRAFGDEWRAKPGAPTPPLQAIAIGADADNTRGQSLAFITGLALRPLPEPGPRR